MSKRKVGGLLLALSALLLSGCSNPSDAASYKSGRIPVKQVQDSVSTILNERIKFNTTPQDGLSGEALTRNQLGFKIFSVLLTQVAKERNIVALPGEISARRADIVKNVGSEDQLSIALVNAGIASTDLDQYIALTVLQDKLKTVIAPGVTDDNQILQTLQKILAETAIKEELKVNPRYGFWNVNTSKVEAVDATGGALSTPTK